MTSKLNFHHNFLTPQINEPKSVQNKADPPHNSKICFLCVYAREEKIFKQF